MSTYAVNLGDLVGQVENMPVMALFGPVLGGSVINAWPKSVDGILLPLTCDDERAAAIVEVLRMKLARYQLRMYVSKTGRGGWKAV